MHCVAIGLNNMIKRVLLIFNLFLASLTIFMGQKPLFMLFNSDAHPEVGFMDYLEVIWHGLPLDLTTSAYITAVPWLVVLASWFVGRGVKFPIRKILVPYYFVIAFIMALIFVADTVLYGFWNFKIDSTVFIYTDKPGDALASVSTWYVVMCVTAILVFFISYLSSFRVCLPKKPWSRPFFKVSSLIMLLVGGLLFLAIRGGVGEGTANVSNVYYSSNQFLNHSAVNPVFNMLYSMMHQQDFSKEFRYLDDQERETLVKDIYPRKSADTAAEELSDTLLNCKNPNVLLIVWEGCGSNVVKSLGGAKDVTPNLQRIADEGVLFTQCYANSFRTDRGLVSIMTGWLGMPSASLMKVPNKCNNLPGIAKMLQSEGYETDFWYGGDISFTNMGGFMIANGFQNTHSDSDFSSNDRSYSKWGVVDGILLDTLASTITQRSYDALHPWFTSVLTLSSHEPWEVPYSRLQNDKQNAFAYTDDCLGRFINRLKQSEQWKNLLVVIVPDHGAIVDDKESRSSLSVVHIPLVFTGGAINAPGKRIDTIMNQSDLAATLLGQLGANHSDFLFSRNVLSKSYAYPTAIHTSPIDATFIDSTGVTTYDIVGNCVTFGTDSNAESPRISKIKATLQTLYNKAAEL